MELPLTDRRRESANLPERHLLGRRLLIWLCALVAGCNPSAEVEPPRELLSSAFLRGTEPLATPVSTAAFQPRPTEATLNRFEGRLTLEAGSTEGNIEYLLDRFDQSEEAELRLADLPVFDFELIQDGNALIPLKRGRQAAAHPYWEWVLEAGRAWDEANDQGWTRAALPFALAQRNANCTHNGLLTFLYKSDGSVSRVAYQVVSETCYYFQANLWGVVAARYQPGPVSGRPAVLEAYRSEVSARLPARPLENLAADYPGANLASFRLHDPTEVSTYGFVIEGVHYSGGCPTRFGLYPFCEVIDLPSYSLAKTIVAGSVFMQLEQAYPGASNLLVTDYVPECRGDERWQGVTLAHLLDMSSGNYQSTVNQEDEYFSYQGPMFSADSHAAKIAHACSLFPRRAEPGTTWVYHTSDTYIAGTLMNAFLREQAGNQIDLFTDLLAANILQPLHFSATMRGTLRSYDPVAQPFTGYGLTLHPDDVARYAQFLLTSEGRVNGRQVLSPAPLAAALQKNPADPGLPAATDKLRYNNGVWSAEILLPPPCDSPAWVPFMSGYGGISVAMLPNGSVYYVFSDGAHFKWADAAVESHRIKPFCESNSEYIQ